MAEYRNANQRVASSPYENQIYNQQAMAARQRQGGPDYEDVVKDIAEKYITNEISEEGALALADKFGISSDGLGVAILNGIEFATGRKSGEDAAFGAAAGYADSLLPGIGGALNFGKALAGGLDGRQAVQAGIQSGAATVGSIFGGPLGGAAAAKWAEPFAEDVSSLGSSTDATREAVANYGAYIVNPMTYAARVAGIDELDFISDGISKGLKSLGFKGGNKATAARGKINERFNDLIAENELGLEPFSDFRNGFVPVDGGPALIDQELSGYRQLVGDQQVDDLIRTGEIFTSALGQGGEAAGRYNMGRSIAANVGGDKEKASQFFEAAGAGPDALYNQLLTGFNDGQFSVVEAVEGARALDRLYGTGYAGSNEIGQIASMVEAGGTDRLADGSEFVIPENGGRIRRENFLDDKGNSRSSGYTPPITVSPYQEQTYPTQQLNTRPLTSQTISNLPEKQDTPGASVDWSKVQQLTPPGSTVGKEWYGEGFENGLSDVQHLIGGDMAGKMPVDWSKVKPVDSNLYDSPYKEQTGNTRPLKVESGYYRPGMSLEQKDKMIADIGSRMWKGEMTKDEAIAKQTKLNEAFSLYNR